MPRNRDAEQHAEHTANPRSQGENFAAVEAIGGVAGNEKKKNSGKKLREADEAEVERAFGDFVDLPSDGDGLHLRGENDEKRAI